MIARNSWNQPAPSSRADSYRAGSILVMPVSSRTVQKPSSTQIPMMPTAGSAVSKSPSQARVTSPSPIAVRTWLTRPGSDSSRPQMMPAATSGMTCGRNRTVRDTVPRRPRRDAMDDARGDEPERDRDEAEEQDQPERVEERLEELAAR